MDIVLCAPDKTFEGIDPCNIHAYGGEPIFYVCAFRFHRLFLDVCKAEAIANYSHLFRRSEGLYLSFPDMDRMEDDFLEQTRGWEIDLIVCTDSEAILGIGDQGVGVSFSFLASKQTPSLITVGSYI